MRNSIEPNTPSTALLAALGAALSAYSTNDEVGLLIARARVLAVIEAEAAEPAPASTGKRK